MELCGTSDVPMTCQIRLEMAALPSSHLELPTLRYDLLCAPALTWGKTELYFWESLSATKYLHQWDIVSLWTPIRVTVIIAFAFGCAAKGCCIPLAVLYFVLPLLPGQPEFICQS